MDDTNNAFSYTDNGKIMPSTVSNLNSTADTTISVTDPVEVERDFNFSVIFDRSIFEAPNKVLIVTLVNPKSASSTVGLYDINTANLSGVQSNGVMCKIPLEDLNTGASDNLYNILVLISH